MSVTKYQKDFNSPGTLSFSITPNDSTDLSEMPRFIMVTTAGNITFDLKDDSTGTNNIVYCAAGVPIPLVTKRIRATGTTATGIVGFT